MLTDSYDPNVQSDAGQGFSANIQTNEPGVESHKAADAEYLKN